jgi:hypothetical protein
MAVFADIQNCISYRVFSIYADIVIVWVRKGIKIC